MNKTLADLMKKLSIQIEEIDQHRQQITWKLISLEKKCDEIQEKTHSATITTAIVHPEQEIARLAFLMKNQQLEERIQEEKKALVAQAQQLEIRQRRLNLELKMLASYREKLGKNFNEKPQSSLVSED